MSAPQLPIPHLTFLFPPQGFGGGAIIIAPIDIPAILRSSTYDTTTSSTDSTLITAAPGLDVTTDTTDSILSTITTGVET